MGARCPLGASLEGSLAAVPAMLHGLVSLQDGCDPQGCGGMKELHGKNQRLLEVVACIVLACCLCQANLFFFYLLLPLIFLFKEPIGR